MNKIIACVALVAISALIACCGQKENIFDHKLFSVLVPDGWKVTQDKDDAYSVMIEKSSTDYLSIECTDSNTDTYETMFAKFKSSEAFKDARFEDETIGKYTFKKLSLGKIKNSSALYYLRDNIGIMMEVANLERTEQQAIIKSLVIK